MRPPGYLLAIVCMLILLLFAGAAAAQGIASDAAGAPPVASAIDLSGILNQLLQLIGAVILAALGTIGTMVLNKLRTKYGIEATDAQKAEFEGIATKAVTWGIAQSGDAIRAKGWDHADVHNQIAALAANYAIVQFPEAMKNAGLDISSPDAMAATAQTLAGGIMRRVLPDAAAAVAASPATPPVTAPASPLLPIPPAAPPAAAAADAPAPA